MLCTAVYYTRIECICLRTYSVHNNNETCETRLSIRRLNIVCAILCVVYGVYVLYLIINTIEIPDIYIMHSYYVCDANKHAVT